MTMKKPHYILLIIAFSLASCKATPTVTDAQIATTTKLLLNGETFGCGIFSVYKGTEDRTKSVMVSNKSGEIQVIKIPKTYDIENTPGLEVRFYDFGKGYHGEL